MVSDAFLSANNHAITDMASPQSLPNGNNSESPTPSSDKSNGKIVEETPVAEVKPTKPPIEMIYTRWIDQLRMKWPIIGSGS